LFGTGSAKRTVHSRDILSLLMLVLIFYLIARVGNEVDALRAALSLIWPASGIGLVLILQYGFRVWPLIFIASMLAAWPTIGTGIDAAQGETANRLISLALVGGGATLDAVLVALGIRWLGADAWLQRAKPFLLASLIAMPLGAAIGTVPQLLGTALGGQLQEILPVLWRRDLLLAWHAMAVADLIGMLVLAPPILLWLRNPGWQLPGRQALELLAYVLLVISALLIREVFQAVYLLFAIHIAIALRMPLKWTALSVSLTSLVLLWQAGAQLDAALPAAIFELFLAELSIVMILNITTYATAMLWQDMQAARDTLESRIRERTRELEAANAQLQTLSHTDALTGAWNRRYFGYRGSREIERARKNQTRLGLLIVDIDHFKQINDNCGHAAGDCILKETVTRLNSELRPTDVLARIGGEEFVVLLPECGVAYAVDVAERLRLAMEQAAFTTPDGHELNVTVSIGIDVFHPCPGDSGTNERLESMLSRADRRLYQAKESGRNRVCGPAMTN